ncbi:hypothetical protein [Persicobacter psychrovividus]|uniref:Lipoprotein n=1 Tax=Persicobacter psychrovividus TaxID=387638 RepID=A0ABN6L627_9BACT|nr:hypothetical protein PEPS_07110 [Persicobacter psychrovividus]
MKLNLPLLLLIALFGYGCANTDSPDYSASILKLERTTDHQLKVDYQAEGFAHFYLMLSNTELINDTTYIFKQQIDPAQQTVIVPFSPTDTMTQIFAEISIRPALQTTHEFGRSNVLAKKLETISLK